jgi:tetratricopeptide (TPR) repeat protein
MQRIVSWWLRHVTLLTAAWLVTAQPTPADETPPVPELAPLGAAAEDASAEPDSAEPAPAETVSAEPSPAADEPQEPPAGASDSPPQVLRVAQPASSIKLRMIEPDRPAPAASSEEPLEKPADPPAAQQPETVAEAGEPEQAPREEIAELKPAEGSSSPAESAEPLKPIPDPHESGPVEVEVATFKGVAPGVTAVSELQKAWGDPLKVANQDGAEVYLYRVDPFDQVEVTLAEDKVVSIVIRLQASFPAHTVAQQLQLSNVRPVLVSNDLGQVLGQSFPERGVLFAFEPNEEPGKSTMKVSSVILEPVSAESFVLRAETYLEGRTEFSLRDLDKAIELDPSNDRAHWLRARALAAMGQPLKGGIASDQAVQLNPKNAQYRLTRAQILGQVGRFSEAVQESERALQDAEKRPHVQARALCLLGDLVSSGLKPDYKKAYEYHSSALETASPLAQSRHPAVRIAAKKVLLDAHLGAANDIAWGFWDEKQKAVPRWLERAEDIAEDMILNERASEELRLRVATRALASYVGLEGQLDPTEWVEKTMETGEGLIASGGDSPQTRQLQWDLGMALYDAVQTYQMRGEHTAALKYGERAIECFEQGRSLDPDSVADGYLLGRLYFRLGAIHSIGSENHRAAITWFEKAIPVFEQVIAKMSDAEHGRLGETFVSMGVSYWNTGQKEKAVDLTERGVRLIEGSVKSGNVPKTALEVPYSNLATMHRELGNADKADEFFQQAQQQGNTRLR